MNRLGIWILRILLLITCGVSGYFFSKEFFSSSRIALLGFIGGLFLACLIFLIERELKKIPLKSLLGGIIGLILGVLIANLFSNLFSLNPFHPPESIFPLLIILYGIGGYIGLWIGFKKGEEVYLSGWRLFSKNVPQSGNKKILDTSVIIDGRIADITETGFLEGTLIIPQFVLNELQHIADSSDSIKRTRGKRGLEVLHHIQKQAGIEVQILDKDYPSVKEVDSKLIELAKELRAKIITNDSNLNKIAELQGIEVLNINELANSIKPVVLPGEEINVKILKEGKESGQGVAYLDDGTMIVVDNGRKQMGKMVDVIVTSVLQTPAGRMIFARLKEEVNKENKGKDYYYSLDSEF